MDDLQDEDTINQIEETLSKTIEIFGDVDSVSMPHKSEEIDDRVRAMVAERGRPSNSEQAIQFAQEAYETVSERHKRRSPQPRAMKAAKSGKLSGSPEAKPQSLREAIELAISNG